MTGHLAQATASPGTAAWHALRAGLALAVVVFTGYLLAGCAWLVVRLLPWRRVLAALRTAPGRLRESRRLALHRLTLGRWVPRYRWEPMNGGEPLDEDELSDFADLMHAWRQRGVFADEPDNTRRRT